MEKRVKPNWWCATQGQTQPSHNRVLLKHIEMTRKIRFLLIVVFFTSVISLLHHDSIWRWITDTTYGCPSFPFLFVPSKKPKHINVAFIKTHKTAGTNMQSMMMRFADRHNLTVMLPIESCHVDFCYPQWFRASNVHPGMLSANILASHLRFDRKEVQRLMPKDTIYITIMREPGAMFDSAFYYYLHYCKSFMNVPGHSLAGFLADPQRYYQQNEPFSRFTKNTMTFDLGKDKDHPATDTAYVQAFLAEMEETFSLVMITEYFDESLVVLRHLLSWDLEDILYFRLNMRKESTKKQLSPDLVSKARAWNALDTYLYDHFNASLWQKIGALGPGCVEREVRELRQAMDNLMRSCFKGTMPLLAAKQINPESRPWQPAGDIDIMGYVLPENFSHGLSQHTQELCRKIILPGYVYGRMIQQSQAERYKARQQQQTQNIHKSTKKS
ncbi:galactose-3-O-sulfotransferase 3-like isoform X2 [Antennarius striatus]|uniref:galactose-3-O-sulfotransferase 3-like isoform X2 n=1 Tax=Antennarius striatus TaxID=241820 RepID=UPI0035B11DED